MRTIVVFLLFLICVSCVKTDDFDLPEVTSETVNFEGNLTSIAAVKGNFNFDTGEIINFHDTNTWFEGYVVSSDAAGNFYKKLVIQDKPENPASGIQILLDDNSLSETYNFGRKIYVKLDGLSMGFGNGVLQLGLQNRGDIVALPNSMIDDHILRSEQTFEIKPKPFSISDFTADITNIYIKLNGVQFDKNLVRENDIFSFASNQVDQYDGSRELESCETGETVVLSTSTFSDFKNLLLPTGSGTVEGVLTRDFYDEQFVIILNTPDNIHLDGPRCDPEYFNCGSATEESSQVLFEENFDGVTSNTTLNSRHWTNVNVSGGEKKWTPTLSNGNRVLRISAYNTNESPLEAWLVTPEIELNNSNSEVLSFDLLSSYDNGMFLKVFVTSNFTGDPGTTEWIPLDASIPLGPSGGNSERFKKSIMDISCLEGSAWFGFQYLGAAPDKTTTYDLDNVRITRN